MDFETFTFRKCFLVAFDGGGGGGRSSNLRLEEGVDKEFGDIFNGIGFDYCLIDIEE